MKKAGTTELELKVRQLENDRDFWKRKAKAIEEKYAPFKNRSFIALMATKRGKKWSGEVSFVENNEDSVQANNYLRNLMLGLAKEMESDGYYVSEEAK